MDAFFDGVMISPPYICLALAYGLVYGMLGVMDLTISVRFTAAAYVGWLGSRLLGWHPSVDPCVLVGGVLAAAILGIACWLLVEPLTRGAPLAALVGSLGLVYVLQSVFQFAFGASPRVYLSYPVESGMNFLGISGTPLQWVGVAYALVAVIGVGVMLHTHGWGRRLHAVAADTEFASSVLGIDPSKVALSTAILASVVIAPAAIFYAAAHGVSPTTGADIGLTAFVATIMAGRGRPLGAAGVALMLVSARSVAIRWTIWELSGSIVIGVIGFWIAGRFTDGPARRWGIGLALAAVGFFMISTGLESWPEALPHVVIPASFQDVVPYVLVLAGLLLRPTGLLSGQVARAV